MTVKDRRHFNSLRHRIIEDHIIVCRALCRKHSQTGTQILSQLPDPRTARKCKHCLTKCVQNAICRVRIVGGDVLGNLLEIGIRLPG